RQRTTLVRWLARACQQGRARTRSESEALALYLWAVFEAACEVSRTRLETAQESLRKSAGEELRGGADVGSHVQDHVEPLAGKRVAQVMNHVRASRETRSLSAQWYREAGAQPARAERRPSASGIRVRCWSEACRAYAYSSTTMTTR